MPRINKGRPNIILIVADALRARNLGCYGYPFPTTPNIDKLAKQGLLFKNCFSVTTSTDPAFTSIFSGLYPFSHGILNHGNRVTEEEEKKVAANIAIPKLGMSMREATLVEWKFKEGDFVEEGQVVLIIETDKTKWEVEAAGSGFLHIGVQRIRRNLWERSSVCWSRVLRNWKL